MGLTDDFDSDDNKTGLPVIYMSVGVISFILFILCLVLVINREERYSEKARAAAEKKQQEIQIEEEKASEPELGASTLTSDQLDFWDMYKEDSSDLGESKTLSENNYAQKAQALREEEEEEDLSEGGTKTKVTLPDGSEQWVMVNAYIAKNKYDYVGMVSQEPLMKYYENGQKISYMGVDVSKSTGTVNFEQLKGAGIEYAMIRLGSRGYSTGQISMDENYFTNMENAKSAGLSLGVIFYSQAVSVEEAAEEAELVIDNLADYNITYPVVFQMDMISNDKARTDNLSKMQLTEIATAFCDRIAEAGYTPMIYGNKYWLLRKIDLTKLGKYEIWLSQSEDIPDYPYTFSMWQYTQNGKIPGIAGEANLSISFVNYDMR
ncbi:MAG: hypothetical protein HDR01_11190 [Lachnospiraceae bacterium]|nr:hypothetical protein [Lachnospiraceae bacterium]